jgi:prepilin-type N-terminal cleavage/methylation domain-containing protein
MAAGQNKMQLGWKAPPQAQRSAFTLIETLVVVAIIALLMALMLPKLGRSLRQARSTVCQANLKDVFSALDMYQTENAGWLPTVDAAAAFRSADSWSARLYRENPGAAGALICPDDPWAAIMRNSLTLHGLEAVGNSSYGLNDFIVSSPDSFLANLARFRPRRPDETILVADMGPDLSVSGGGNSIEAPSRNYGRLAIDDAYRPGNPPELKSHSWLTGRHSGRINVLSMVGNVRGVDVEPVLLRQVRSYYPTCAAQFCTICVDMDLPHYSFSEARAFWWTGPAPRP